MKNLIGLFILSLLSNHAWAVISQFNADMDAGVFESANCLNCGAQANSKITLRDSLKISQETHCQVEISESQYSYVSGLQSNLQYSVNEVIPGEFYCDFKNNQWKFSLGARSLEMSQNIGPQATEIFQAYDYRSTIFVDSRYRYTQPMIKADYFGTDSTVTLIGATSPSFNQYSQDLWANSPVPVSSTSSNVQNLDLGARVNFSHSGYDFSVSAFNLQDRTPQPVFNSTVNQIQLHHDLMSTYGFGVTHAIMGGVGRFDFQYIQNRNVSNSTFSAISTNQNAWTIGYDTPTVWNSIFYFQITNLSVININFKPYLDPKLEYLSVKIAHPIPKVGTIDFTAFQSVYDNSSAFKLDFSWAASKTLDVHIGEELYSIDKTQELANYYNATKTYLDVLGHL